jgi:purine nucleoside phosphorylase
MSENGMKGAFKNAKLVDYTGSYKGFQHLKQFGNDFVDLVRKCKDGAKAVVVIDKAIDSNVKAPLLVRDHINLSGDNPLLGPNDPIGQRFPVVQEIYYYDLPSGLASGVIAGLAPQVVPTSNDQKNLKEIGVDACSYNMVSSMLIAAHAGWKVLGIVVPENQTLSDDQQKQIHDLVEGK